MLHFSLLEKNYKQYHKDFLKITKIISIKLNIKKELFFDINFVKDKDIQIINSKYRKIDKPTDVISFAFNDGKSKTNFNLIGEIFISIDTAKKDAKEEKVSLKQKVCLLFIHGILHLLGYDHANKKDEKIMFDLQNKILNHVI
jgi:probable rRNA maturation factor